MWLLANHLPFGLLVDLAEERAVLTPDQQAHLETCERCAADLAWIRGLLALARGGAGEEPPAHAVARAKALFRERRGGEHVASSTIQARLRFDSASGAPAFGLRAEASLERQLLLSAGSYDLDLRITPSGHGWAVAGQILPAGATPPTEGAVTLLGQLDWARAELSELSEFSLPPVRSGRYNLMISLGPRAIIFPGLELGS